MRNPMLYHNRAYRLASIYRPTMRDVLALQTGVVELMRLAGGSTSRFGA
jgi:hypothetical protein